ncbi:MAG: NBR1-Ig-like domain-containing protein [Anaerolineales bacterium]
MSKKALSIILLMGIVLSACGGQATEQATETPTALPATTAPPALPPTATATKEVEAATDTPAPSPTATEFVPDNPADCVNKATFVSDVTIPDNSNVAAGAAFVKTWRVRNDGTCIWWSGYTLTHYSEETLSAPDSVPLPVTNPGETADISIDLVAPSVAGTYQGNFVIENPEGLIMQIDNDSRLWVIINVSSTPTDTPTATSTTTGVSGTVPATATTSGSNSSAVSATCAFTTDTTRTTAMVSALTTYRTQNNLSALPINVQLSQAAQRHADDMACNQLFGHNGSDGSTPASRVATTGYTASDVTENVYGSYPPLTGQGVISWWATDQTDIRHNENLLTTKFTEIGVGYAFFNNYGFYVIVFATP